ncbi:hypothetical protein PGTUg99_019823 [Puccinia graminis f. sp. tritici]|uniref:Uncharacterized protein n=1 Tax=Puccinia graminis f. sp. tritici TaxID=56615 RepID=A0A5B0M988_PUCGR|nr:hypothetical protein PGTUg99_019823 [Puccinia graminis f. sp. tritici]
MRLGLKAACFSVQKVQEELGTSSSALLFPSHPIAGWILNCDWSYEDFKARLLYDVFIPFNCIHEFTAAFWPLVEKGIHPFYPLFNIHQYERSGIPVFSKYQALIVHCRRFALNGSSAISGAQFLLDSNPPCRLKSIDLFLMPPRGGYCDFPSLAFHDQRIASGSSAGM